MKLEGERTLPGQPEQVWEMLLDPDVLVTAIPGCKKLEKVEEDHYKGGIAAKVGSIQSEYQTTFKITDKHPPERYTIKVEGQGQAGFVNGEARMAMQAEGDEKTRLRYDIDAQVGGRIAQVGQRMIRATATALIDNGFNELRDTMETRLAPGGSRDGAANAQRQAAPGGRQRSELEELWRRIRNFVSAAVAFARALLASEPDSRR